MRREAGTSRAQPTAATRAYTQIRSRILRCGLPPGTVIHERSLMQELDLGRTPIREALLRLSAEQLVMFSGQSIQVTPVTLDGIGALYTARLHAERLAWRLWLRNSSGEARERLAAVFAPAEALARKGDEEGLVDLDFRFHSQVYEECGNPFLTSHLHNLTGFSFRIWFMTNPHELAHHILNVRMHDPIIAAVHAGDAEALDREVTTHISHSFSTAVERMKGSAFSAATQLDLKVVQQ